MDERPDEEHLPPSPELVEQLRSVSRNSGDASDAPRAATYPVGMRRRGAGRQSLSPHQILHQRRLRRVARAAWTRLEALAITTNARLLRAVRAVVLGP